MKDTKSIKKAFVSSVVALFLCFAMLLGTTYAWFTDSVTSGNNIIKSGTLDVQLLMYNGTEYVDISESEKPIFGEDSLISDWEDVNYLWEPGKTQIVYLCVKNAGSLALKYNVLVDVEDKGLIGSLDYAIIDGVTKDDADALAITSWSELLSVDGVQGALVESGRTVAAENGALESDSCDYFALAIHMNEEAGNEYKDKSIVVDISIMATQLSKESDSFGDDYDAGLEPTTTYMFSGADLHNSTTKSGKFELSEDITTSESSARYGWGYEYIIRKGADYTLDLNGKTIVHDTVNDNGNGDGLTYLFVANNAGSKLTIDGEGKIYSNNGAGYTCAVQGKDGTLVTINGGDFEVDNGIAVWAGTGSHIVINGGSFVNGNATTDHELIYTSGGTIDIYGGFFHNTDGNYTLNVEDRNRATSSITVYGGTYVNFDPSTGGQDPEQIKVADGYMVSKETQSNGDVWYTVVPIPEGSKTASSYESLTANKGESGNHVLTGDIVMNNILYFGDNTENTVDLNGRNVTTDCGYVFGANGNNCVLTIEGNGTVSAGAAFAAFTDSGSTLNINGGTFNLGETNNAAHLYAQNSSTIVINGGMFISTDANTPIVYCINGFVEINGGFFQNTANSGAALISMGNNLNYVNNQKVTLSGGTFVNWNPMNSAFAYDWPQCPALIVLAEGYEMISETQANGDVWYTVVPIE